MIAHGSVQVLQSSEVDSQGHQLMLELDPVIGIKYK